MQKYHSIWKGRQVIEGAPTHSQDVSREIEILSLTGEKEGEAIMQATRDLKTNRRPFAALVDTKMLQALEIKIQARRAFLRTTTGQNRQMSF